MPAPTPPSGQTPATFDAEIDSRAGGRAATPRDERRNRQRRRRLIARRRRGRRPVGRRGRRCRHRPRRAARPRDFRRRIDSRAGGRAGTCDERRNRQRRRRLVARRRRAGDRRRRIRPAGDGHGRTLIRFPGRRRERRRRVRRRARPRVLGRNDEDEVVLPAEGHHVQVAQTGPTRDRRAVQPRPVRAAEILQEPRGGGRVERDPRMRLRYDAIGDHDGVRRSAPDRRVPADPVIGPRQRARPAEKSRLHAAPRSLHVRQAMRAWSSTRLRRRPR